MENLENNVVKNENTDAEVKEEKTFTQAELEEILSKRLAKEKKKQEAIAEKEYQARLKAELEESEKLAQMNQAEREKAEREKAKAEKERKEFELEKARYEQERREFEQAKIKAQTMQMLGERKIPVELAQFITSNNADEIMDNVNTFEKCFNEAVEKVVTERLRGKTPTTSIVSNGKITKEQFNKMRIDERSRLFKENPSLYAELTK